MSGSSRLGWRDHLPRRRDVGTNTTSGAVMARWYRLVLVLVGSVMVAAVAPLAGAQNQSLNLALTTQNNSGVGGTVMLADQGNGKTRVTIQATGAGAGPQPAHIHPGSCAQLDP